MSYQNLPQRYLHSLSAPFYEAVDIPSFAKMYYSLMVMSLDFSIYSLLNYSTMFCYKLENPNLCCNRLAHHSHLISKGTEQEQLRKLSHKLQDINWKITHFTVWTGWAYGICFPLTTLCLPYLWLLEMLFMSCCPMLLPFFRLSKSKHNKMTLKNHCGGHMLIWNVTSTYHHLHQTGRSGKTRVPETNQTTELRHGYWGIACEDSMSPVWFLCLWIFYPNTHCPWAYWQGCANPAHGIRRVQAMTAQTREISARCKKRV